LFITLPYSKEVRLWLEVIDLALQSDIVVVFCSFEVLTMNVFDQKFIQKGSILRKQSVPVLIITLPYSKEVRLWLQVIDLAS
jgi:hypothetical protein